MFPQWVIQRDKHNKLCWSQSTSLQWQRLANDQPLIFYFFFTTFRFWNFIFNYELLNYRHKIHERGSSNRQKQKLVLILTHFTKSTKTPPKNIIQPTRGARFDIDEADNITELITFIFLCFCSVCTWTKIYFLISSLYHFFLQITYFSLSLSDVFMKLFFRHGTKEFSSAQHVSSTRNDYGIFSARPVLRAQPKLEKENERNRESFSSVGGFVGIKQQ